MSNFQIKQRVILTEDCEDGPEFGTKGWTGVISEMTESIPTPYYIIYDNGSAGWMQESGVRLESVSKNLWIRLRHNRART
jgi:hypothetical protein